MMTTRVGKHRPTKRVPKDVSDYLKSIENDQPKACKDLHKLVPLVKAAFKTGDIWFNEEQYDAYLKIGEAMYPKVFPWQKFLCALLLCTYRCEDDRPRWNHAFIMTGRGSGKDGIIAWFSLCLTSKNNPIKDYDVDICANNEDQSMRPVKDAIAFLNNPVYKASNKASFYWTTEVVKGLQNKGIIKGHTNNARGKDGLRSGCVILNEIHEYEDYSNIDVFITGLGKKPCPRSLYFSTNGYVREGVLDGELAHAESILNGETEDHGFFPFVCRIDSKDEAFDESCWVKANPSLPYFPDLMDETRKEFETWKAAPDTLPGFMAKRMNLPTMESAHAVTDYEHIKATNRPLIDLSGEWCVVGIDTAKASDFESVVALFRHDGFFYVINHTWVCMQSKDMPRIKFKSEFPRLEKMGLITLVDDVEIPSSYVTDYLNELKESYGIMVVCIDDFRYALFANELTKSGFTKQNNNLKLVRPSDIAKVVPVIESAFLSDKFIWGDNPMLRWATNNTKVIPWKIRSTGSNDLGNQMYAKIEPHGRKTDPFMALVHAMTESQRLQEPDAFDMDAFKVVTY